MSESTTTTTTTKKATSPTPSATKDKWRFAGYWNALIGAFVLIVQGILLFLSAIPGISNIGFLGAGNFFTFATWGFWLAAALQIALGIFALILIWEVIQRALNIGVIIKDTMWLGIILIIIGVLTLGVGGTLVLVGGIFYLLGIPK